VTPDPTQARSGRPIGEITLAALEHGELGSDDVRIHPDTLRHQADLAAAQGYHPFAENLRRAAELTSIPDEELIEIYDLLRPNRATATELEAVAERLAPSAPLTAALVRSAREAYARRGLLRAEP
jgi:propanediol dehydratase small subunit